MKAKKAEKDFLRAEEELHEVMERKLHGKEAAMNKGKKPKKDKHEKGESRKEECEEHSGKGHKSEKGERHKPMKKGGKIAKVLHEYKSGELHSGSKQGPLVKSKRQALAIAMNEARKRG